MGNGLVVRYGTCTISIILKKGQGIHHDDRRHDSHDFLDSSPGVNHVIQKIQCERSIKVVSSDSVLFFPDLGQNFRVIGGQLESVNDGARHGILSSEEERQDDQSNLLVRELSSEQFGIITTAVLDSSSRVDHGSSPLVQQTQRLLGGVLHPLLGSGRSSHQVFHDEFSSLDGVVNLGSRDGQGEVDEFQSQSDQPVLFIDLLFLLSSNVWADKDGEGSLHVEISHESHVRLGRRGVVHPLLEKVTVDSFLDRQVGGQGFPGEQDVERLSIIDVSFTVQEDPVFREEDLLCRVNETRLGVVGRVEDFSRHLVGRSDDDETGIRLI